MPPRVAVTSFCAKDIFARIHGIRSLVPWSSTGLYPSATPGPGLSGCSGKSITKPDLQRTQLTPPVNLQTLAQAVHDVDSALVVDLDCSGAPEQLLHTGRLFSVFLVLVLLRPDFGL